MSKCSFSPFPPSENHRFLEPSSLLPGQNTGLFAASSELLPPKWSFSAPNVITLPLRSNHLGRKNAVGISKFTVRKSEKRGKKADFRTKIGGLSLSKRSKSPVLPTRNSKNRISSVYSSEPFLHDLSFRNFHSFSLFSFLFVSTPCPFFPFLRSPCQKAGPPLPAASCPHCPFAHAPTAKPRPRCPYLPKFRCVTMTSVKKPRIFSPYGLRRLCRFREKTYICRF